MKETRRKDQNSAEESNYVQLALLCGTLILMAIAAGAWLGLFSWLNLFSYDLHFNIRGARPTSGEVVLVYMDQTSSFELGRKQGNWSRRYMATALRNLHSAGAEIIGLDMIFSSPGYDPQADRELAEAIYACNNVVLARIASAPYFGAVTPLEIFRAGMIGDGFIDLPLDRDECLRRIRFFSAVPTPNDEVELVPAFALELVRTYLNLDYCFDFSSADHFIMGAPDGKNIALPYPELRINYYGTDAVFPRLSYADVVYNRFDPEVVRGKIVMLGSNLQTEKDFFTTAFTRHGSEVDSFQGMFRSVVADVQHSKATGLSCHAHAIETILEHAYIHSPGTRTIVLWWLGVWLIGQWLFYRRNAIVPALLALPLSWVLVFTTSQWLFNRNIWLASPPILVLLGLQMVSGFALQKRHEKKRSRRITGMFGKYVSDSIVQQLIDGRISPEMGGQRKNLSIFFSDLRSFTSLAERLDAQQTATLLNRYFAAMIPIVQANSGTVDKLIGDAILAFFGAPLPDANHQSHAAAAGLLMLQGLEQLKEEPIPGVSELNLGIGINSGDVTIGNLGCDKFMDYTVVGDNVNLASRLEGLNKVYGTRIILSEYTAAALTHEFCVRELDRVVVKGKHQPVTIYELMGYQKHLPRETLEMLDCFHAALELYRRQEWQQACAKLNMALKLQPQDGPSALYLQRATTFCKTPPPHDWDGLTRFHEK